ncbi:MAG: metallophosphoesterase [Candidatus Promineifilaceae bacterium]
MNLFAIGDLHINHQANLDALRVLPPHKEDWLLIAGDIGDTFAQIKVGLTLLAERFEKLFFTPGNHDLWTTPNDPEQSRGVARYWQIIDLCHSLGIVTPEDPPVQWPSSNPPLWIMPTFTLYDYSFRPDNVPLATAVSWAESSGVVCTDEILLPPNPYPTRQSWCAARCQQTEEKLAAIQTGKIILLNHYPLHQELAVLPRIPRFSLWCGTKRTAHWTKNYPIHTAVYGHLHIRSSQQINGIRHEEVSLGYPQNWQQAKGIRPYLRPILTNNT